jgi:hypothetical protein
MAEHFAISFLARSGTDRCPKGLSLDRARFQHEHIMPVKCGKRRLDRSAHVGEQRLQRAPEGGEDPHQDQTKYARNDPILQRRHGAPIARKFLHAPM